MRKLFSMTSVRTTTTIYDPRDDLGKIRETLAVQNQVLSTIVQKQEQSAQMASQQSAQLAVVSTDVAILKSEMPKFQTELASLTAWKTDALNLFIPRREHEALHHEERIAELEEWRRAEQNDKVADQKSKNIEQRNIFQWIADHALTLILFLLTFGFTLFNVFYHP